ncbi:hypothetical protein [Neobacillus niacini]|uniref:hypothetical protein n=1 Tax=Neobacillus niacini TaxID=86668 RepID=UPI0005EF66B5|nr:hypothetical protein [Neobacillus niacini]
MKFCPQCGEKRFQKANFCYECGFKFPWLSKKNENQRVMENQLNNGFARGTALDKNLKEAQEKEMVIDTRIKALKPCDTCSFSKKYNNGSCEIEEKHSLSPQCPSDTWEQKKKAMNVGGELEIRIAQSGQTEDGVYQEGLFIGVHPKNRNTMRMRTLLEKTFPGQDVVVNASVLEENPNSIYTNVLMKVIGLSVPPSSK